jgi:uncharacterized protein
MIAQTAVERRSGHVLSIPVSAARRARFRTQRYPDGMKHVATATMPELAAPGSLPRAPEIAHPELPRRLRLLVELGLVFVGAPLLMAYAVHAHRVPLFVALVPVLLLFIAYLAWDPTFRLRREFTAGFRSTELVVIVLGFVFIALCVGAFIQQQYPRDFLSFPRYRPELWRLVMIFYPLVSVLPQELVYRTFFFHRYGPLFGEHRWLAILANGALFSFGHIIFGNWVAIILSFFLGTLLAYRYVHTRSFLAVWIEHTLYGQLVFTVGLGRYFFTGVSSLT